jgi:hypothetical protein
MPLSSLPPAISSWVIVTRLQVCTGADCAISAARSMQFARMLFAGAADVSQALRHAFTYRVEAGF